MKEKVEALVDRRGSKGFKLFINIYVDVNREGRMNVK